MNKLCSSSKPVSQVVNTTTRTPKQHAHINFVRELSLRNRPAEVVPTRSGFRSMFSHMLKRNVICVTNEDPEPFRILLQFRGRSVAVLVGDMEGLWSVARYHAGEDHLMLIFVCRPLNETKNLEDYGLIRGQVYTINVVSTFLKGGTSNGEASLEQAETFIKLFESGHFDKLKQHIQNMAGSREIGEFVGDKIFATMMSIRNYHTDMDWFSWILNTYGLMTGHSPVSDVKEFIRLHFGPANGRYVQAEMSFRTFIRDARKLFDAGTRDNETFKKLLTLYGAMAARGWLKIFGIEPDPRRIKKFMSEYHLPEWCETAHFGVVFIDTLLFVCERVIDYMETGDVRSLLHSQQLYNDWFEKAEKVQLLSNFLGNLEAHGTNTFEFTNLINEVISRGEVYVKTCRRSSVSDRSLVATLNKIKLIKASTVTKEASSQMRRAPMGVLLHGLSGQAKSTFCNMIKHYYANFSGLPGDDRYTYVRSPVQEYWNNFDSAQWCIIFDDIAFLNPSAANGIDPTIAEVLNVVNNVPYDASQAALEDKGKTPVLADLVIATTNVLHLNASDYFACPFAVRRRLPLIVTVEVKSEYCRLGTKQADPNKIRHNDDEYPNVWKIHVKKLIAVEDNGVEHARVELVKTYTDVNEFFKYFGQCIVAHNDNQRACIHSNDRIKNVKVCKTCFGVGKFCACDVQATVEEIPGDTPDVIIPYGSSRSYIWLRYFTFAWYGSFTALLGDLVSDWTAYCLWVCLECSFANWVFDWCLPRWMLKQSLYYWPLDTRTRVRLVGYINARAEKKVERIKWIAAASMALQFFLTFAIAFLTISSAKRLAVKTAKELSATMRKKTTKERKATTHHSKKSVTHLDDTLGKKLYGGCGPHGDLPCDNSGWDSVSIDLSDDEGAEEGFWGTQGNRFGTTADQLAKETAQNVWYNDAPALTSFDIPTKGRSLVNKTPIELRNMFHNNVVRIRVNNEMEMNAVFVTSQVLLFNTHALGEVRREDNFIDVFCGDKTAGLGPKTRSMFKISEVRTIEGKDVSFMRIHGLPPFKDLLEFWCDSPRICVDEAVQLVRRKNGELVINKIRGIQNMVLHGIFEQPIHVLYGQGDNPSQNGWCGSLVMAMTPLGCTFTGIHVVGRDVSVASHLIMRSTIESMIKSLGEWNIQCGEPPNLHDKKLIDIHPRCLTRYIPEGNIHVYGSFAGFRPKPKTKVRISPIAEDMCEHFNSELLHTKPCMSGWEPWHKNFVEMVKNNTCLDVPAFEKCIDHYVDSCIAELPEAWEKELVELDTAQAIRGIPGVKYIDALNKNTSMGFPWGGPKKRFIIETPTEEDPGNFTMTEEVLKEVDRLEECYRCGERGNPVFTAHLKDEPVTIVKAQNKKTRVFTGSPAPYAIVLRKYLLPFIRLMQKNPFAFESMPGYCAQSRDWGKLYDWLTEFGEDNIIAGDYGKYDKRMAAYLIVASYRIMSRFYERAGFDATYCRAVVAMGYDCAFSWCNFNGTLVQFFGTNPSGHSLTVIVNCIVNALYIRFVYLRSNPDNELASFKSNVHLATYGDDNIAGVHPRVGSWFNHTVVQKMLATIGVEYTMADKESESVPFIHISKASFLKRSWLKDHDVGAYLCPLEFDSIFRSLTVWGPSTMVDDHRVVEVITNAVCEFFFYGRERFEREREFFLVYLDNPKYQYYIRHSDVLPTWEECRAKFEYLTERIETQEGLVSPSVSKITGENNNEKDNEVVVETFNSTLLASRSGVEAVTIFTRDHIQSSNVADQTSENVGFVDSEVGIVENSAPAQSSVARIDGTPDISLGNYLSRPTLIDTRTWSTSDAIGSLGSGFQPWLLYLTDTAIKKKIDNFGFIRGKLKLKFLVNGTPFQYGLLRMCYLPLNGFRTTTFDTSGLSEDTANVIFSQQPGLYLQPQASAGGEMELPFLYFKNWLDLTSASDITNFGYMQPRIFAPLRVASSGGSTSVTILTYAWMEDVELMAPTNKLAVQGDEYQGDGQISGPASAVAKVAGALSNAPIIGPYARATQVVAGTVASVARFFGFCNPPVIEDVRGFIPLAGPMMASSQISTAVQKFTLDPKQELSLDPRLHGLDGTDELNIGYLVQKESLFAKATWSTSDTSGTSLLNMRVTPDMSTFTAFTGYSRAVHIPMSYLAHMFKSWRGDLIVRVKVVASKFHKGRLKFSYDPVADISTINPPANTVYTQILDIGENDDVEIVIPYHQALAWLDCDPNNTTNWNNSGALAPRGGVDNGLFTVRVNTQLVAPTASPVTILFYLRAGENFEFANPTDAIGLNDKKFFTFANVQGDKIDLTPKTMRFGSQTNRDDHGYAQNYGEKIVSLRDVIHRAVLVDRNIVSIATANPALIQKSYKLMPYGPGGNVPATFPTVANTISGSPATIPFAFNYMTHLTWLSGLFLGYRGGVNYYTTPWFGSATLNLAGTIERITDDNPISGETLYGTSRSIVGSVSAKDRDFRNWIKVNGAAGSAIVSTSTNGTIVVNVPDMKYANFSLCNPRGDPYGLEVDGTYDQGCAMNLLTSSTGNCILTNHVAAGVDFTFLKFICCPTVNYYDSLPVGP